MAGKTINMSKLKQIILLRGSGTPLQTIARSLQLSRNTVKKYLRLIEVKGLPANELLSLSDPALDALFDDPDPADQERLASLIKWFPHFEKELKRTGVTRWTLWGEYRRDHPDGFSYSRFCDHFKQYRISRAASLHFEHEPGDKLFLDFTGKKLSIVDPLTGTVTPLEVYVAVLGYSQLTYVEAVMSQRKEDFIAATENALRYFGGVPKVLIPDNLKSAVTKADNYEPAVNDDFLDFANHYQCAVMPTRSYKPRDKAHVERGVSIAYYRIFAPLRDRIFYTISQLNDAIRDLLQVHNDQPFQKRPVSRRQLFEQNEKGFLKPLAVERYELKKFRFATVMKNGYVQLWEDKHYYSVPYRFIGSKVKIIYTNTQVSIFKSNERIAYHIRSPRQFGHTTVHEHMPSSHQFVSEWNPDKFINWAASIDPVMASYVTKILKSAAYPEATYRSCLGILAMEKKVGRQRLIDAVTRATYFGSYSYNVVKNILLNNLDQSPIEEQSTTPSLPEHENVRGASSYQ